MRGPIPIPGWLKAALGRLLCLPVVGRFLSLLFRDSIPSGTCRIDTRSPYIPPALKAAIFWQIYEGAEIRYIERYLRSDLDVVELGSSIGVVACHIRKKQDLSRRLICVEADANLMRALQQNLEHNGLAHNVFALNRAIAYESVSRTAWLRRGDSNITGCVASAGAIGAVAVPAATLSEILAEFSVGEYALVCDIEGSEASILARDPEALRKCRQVLIELHDTEWQGRPVGVEEMYREFCDKHLFRLRDRYGPVCVFEKTESRERPSA